MPKYLTWKKQILSDLSDQNINAQYESGFVFGRIDKGVMVQTRSVRIDLDKFELNSENRRILRKTEEINFKIKDIPYLDYHWTIGKLAKNFYDTKFGEKTFSVFKIKEAITDIKKSNFNKLFIYFCHSREGGNPGVSETELDSRLRGNDKGERVNDREKNENDKNVIGYCICLETNKIIHYSYPFYKLDYPNKSMGMGMMVRAVKHAKESGKKYLYLGSAQRPTDTYKIQFDGLEWFDGKEWQSDIKELKEILKNL